MDAAPPDIDHAWYHSPHDSARPPTHRTDWDAFKSALGNSTSASPSPARRKSTLPLNASLKKCKQHTVRRPPSKDDRRWDLPPFETRAPEETQLAKLWERCPRIKRELNHITQDLRQAVLTFRAPPGETIEQAGEDWKSLHQLCRRLTRSPAPVCPLFDKTGTRRYAARERAEILAEHLEEQFTPHTPSDTPEAASHHAGGTPGGRIPDGPGAALARRLFCFPGRDWQDDFPTAEAEGSGTRRDPDCCHKTAA
ncbi:hypothetical protein EVAR_84829_1 [Eumeta japonica]|uniref:Uncharacterized protein n=1 Tax=Eumeta variegata TaxID=151549 RepID=A0A4C1U8E6_EUMVA|nr:hypothetical protein EVAR_84829_1 [Eumeta japonica]